VTLADETPPLQARFEAAPVSGTLEVTAGADVALESVLLVVAAGAVVLTGLVEGLLVAVAGAHAVKTTASRLRAITKR
jgi:hypothetical protein